MDKRTRHTKAALRKSLLELMDVKNLGKITVKELCERAEVNRSTFYAYYKSPGDLLEKLEAELYESMHSAVMNNICTGDNLKLLENTILVVKEHSDTIKTLLSYIGTQTFIKDIIYIAHDASLENWERLTGCDDRIKLEYIYSFIATGSAGVIRNWLLTGMKEEPLVLASYIERMTYKGLEVFLESK